MNSVKNLLVVVMLMAVSWGAWQVINTPETSLNEEIAEVEGLDIEIGSRIDEFSEPPKAAQPPLHSEPPKPAMSKQRIPGLPPQFRGNGGDLNEKINSEFELPEVQVSEPPPESSSGFPPANNSTALDSQFQPRPQTNLQPVDPKPLADEVTEPGSTPDDKTDRVAASEMESPRAMPPTAQLPPAPSTGFMAQVKNEFATSPPADAEALAATPESLASGSGAASVATTTTPMEHASTGPIDWAGVSELVNAGDARAALETLSRHYDAGLPADQRLRMLQWLDQLAGKVIYSSEHLLEPRPWIVADGDSLETLSAEWDVPPQLILNINRGKIGDPSMLVAGTELKVIRGPFDARLSLDRQELTLFLDGLYAGRFPVNVGTDQPVEQGSFPVAAKSDSGREFQDATGQTIAAGAAGNPYGKYWLALGSDDLFLHESTTEGSNDARGSIRLSSRDAEDLYGILGEGSQVTILR